ncbi:hypothetical protein [Luteimonas vadosa]|uniref:HEPN AbiU2-like domain-containing protein n=1 Tax=Luteimonas vadosa TaxID=1165507 RepID=A0ABP9E5L1_9GAMM
MKGLTPHVAQEFCSLCDWAYHANQIHRHLFDNNPHVDRLINSQFGDALSQLSGVTVEYAALQIAKLHDKAVVSGRVTLSIDYILVYGGWDEPAKSELEMIRKELDSFADKLRQVRNKALSHNDLCAILAGGALGAFEQDEDLAYFDRLKAFANLVSVSAIGKPFSYSSRITATSVGIIRITDALASQLEA